MKTRLRCFVLSTALLSASAASGGPAEDFEELQPTTIMDAPDTVPASKSGDTSEAAHGKYLVELLGCGSCHTDGALIGEPRMDRRLAGSDVGIAYSDPLTESHPGVVYPANLTPDPKTGLGAWTDEEIMRVIRSGLDRTGRKHLPVMPWPAYAKLSDEDALAIAAYLRALPPVEHRVPENVPPGTKATAPYVHFGVYRSTQ